MVPAKPALATVTPTSTHMAFSNGCGLQILFSRTAWTANSISLQKGSGGHFGFAQSSSRAVLLWKAPGARGGGEPEATTL